MNEILNLFFIKSFQLKNSMEKYWRGYMFFKPSGLFTPPLEENGSETKGQLSNLERKFWQGKYNNSNIL